MGEKQYDFLPGFLTNTFLSFSLECALSVDGASIEKVQNYNILWCITVTKALYTSLTKSPKGNQVNKKIKTQAKNFQSIKWHIYTIVSKLQFQSSTLGYTTQIFNLAFVCSLNIGDPIKKLHVCDLCLHLIYFQIVVLWCAIQLLCMMGIVILETSILVATLMVLIAV